MRPLHIFPCKLNKLGIILSISHIKQINAYSYFMSNFYFLSRNHFCKFGKYLFTKAIMFSFKHLIESKKSTFIRQAIMTSQQDLFIFTSIYLQSIIIIQYVMVTGAGRKGQWAETSISFGRPDPRRDTTLETGTGHTPSGWPTW